MADFIPTHAVHHFRLTVSDVDRACDFYTRVLGFRKVMDLNPGAFLTNGTIGLGLGPSPDASRRGTGDRFDENRVGLDHLSFGVASREALDDAVRALDRHGVPHGEIKDLGKDFVLYVVAFRDPDNVQLELSAPYRAA
jgi:catechol 2,3-dioxygenase-like lactoylglutathione lyase family enzyme